MHQASGRSAVALRAMAGQVGKGVVPSIHGYVSIYRRPVLHLTLYNQMRIPHRGATQPLGLRWGFETTSKHLAGFRQKATLTIPNANVRL